MNKAQRDAFLQLSEVHRMWCRYCGGDIKVCETAPKGHCSLRDCEAAFATTDITLDAEFLRRLDAVAKRLMATTEFHQDAHTVLEAGIMLARALDRIVSAERHLDAISEVLEMPKESWRIAGCDVLAHQVRDLLKGYISLRDMPATKGEI